MDRVPSLLHEVLVILMRVFKEYSDRRSPSWGIVRRFLSREGRNIIIRIRKFNFNDIDGMMQITLRLDIT